MGNNNPKIITTSPDLPNITRPSSSNLDGVYAHPASRDAIKTTLPDVGLGRDSFMGTQASGPKKIKTSLHV